jgi:hypothetical protein
VNDVPPVRFDVAAEPRFARLVRTSLGALAALESFSVDRTDDLRLLVDEVFNALIGAGATRITFDVHPAGGGLHIVMRAPVTSHDPRRGFDTAQRVADVIAPGFVLGTADGAVEFAATVSSTPT